MELWSIVFCVAYWMSVWLVLASSKDTSKDEHGRRVRSQKSEKRVGRQDIPGRSSEFPAGEQLSNCAKWVSDKTDEPLMNHSSKQQQKNKTEWAGGEGKSRMVKIKRLPRLATGHTVCMSFP